MKCGSTGERQARHIRHPHRDRASGVSGPDPAATQTPPAAAGRGSPDESRCYPRNYSPRPERASVEEAKREVERQVKLPVGYTFDWGGEYKEYLASQEQMKIILPLTILLILMILFALYGNLKFPAIILLSVLVTEPVGGLLALWLALGKNKPSIVYHNQILSAL